MRPRVALNALALRPGGSGVQTYIRELLRALPGVLDADVVALVQADCVGEIPEALQAEVRPVVSGLRRAVHGLRRVDGFDLVHGLNVAVPKARGARSVATIHDLAVFDVPWAFTRRAAMAKRALYRRVIRSADALIAVSPFTAARIHELFGRGSTVTLEAPPSDCHPVTPEAAAAVRERYGLEDGFVLHVGTVEPRKDVRGLAAACEIAGLPLVLAGATPAGIAGVRARALGYVPRDDLLALYGAARVVAYPSRYEGFGLPVVEAMACGAAVVASRVASLPEVVGDGAVLVAPGAVDELAAALRDLWHDDDRRGELAVAGRKRAASFDWDATATATAAVYRSLGVPV